MSSGEEESLILAEKQESQATPSRAAGVPTLASSPALEAEEVWLSTVAPSHSSVEAGTVVGTHTAPAPASTTPRKRERFKGLNGRHFQQQEPQQGLKGALEASIQPPTPEAAENYVEPPMTTGTTDALGSGQSQSPWAVLTNEVEMPRAGEWGPWGRWDLPGDLREAGEEAPNHSWVPWPPQASEDPSSSGLEPRRPSEEGAAER